MQFIVPILLYRCYCANLKVIRYESRSFNKIVADKSHCVIVALEWCFVISIEVSSDHSQLRCTGFAGSHEHESD